MTDETKSSINGREYNPDARGFTNDYSSGLLEFSPEEFDKLSEEEKKIRERVLEEMIELVRDYTFIQDIKNFYLSMFHPNQHLIINLFLDKLMNI